MIKYRADLYKLLPSVEEAVCVELGVAEGFFSADMLRWGIKKLYSVDLWECNPSLTGDIASPQEWHDKNFMAAKRRLSEFSGRYEILRGPTSKMAQHVLDESCDLVYLDAGHDYKSVMNDLTAWFPKVKIGGVIAGHDYENMSYGVKKAVQDFTENKFNVFLIPENKSEDAGFYFIKS